MTDRSSGIIHACYVLTDGDACGLFCTATGCVADSESNMPQHPSTETPAQSRDRSNRTHTPPLGSRLCYSCH